MANVAQSLLAHGVKPTAQRVVITEYLLNTNNHPTAEEVLNSVAHKLPVPLSRATVYNTLNTLVESGVVKEVVTEAGRTRYDANLEHHHHLVDIKTGRIIDIPWADVPELPQTLTSKFKIHGYQITFFGELS